MRNLRYVRLSLLTLVIMVSTACTATPQPQTQISPALADLDKVALDYLRIKRPNLEVLQEPSPRSSIIDEGAYWEWAYSATYEAWETRPKLQIDKKSLSVIRYSAGGDGPFETSNTSTSPSPILSASTPTIADLNKIALDHLHTKFPNSPPPLERRLWLIDEGNHWSWTYLKPGEVLGLSVGGGAWEVEIDKKTLKVIHAARGQ
jgi:hypothetical protein